MNQLSKQTKNGKPGKMKSKQEQNLTRVTSITRNIKDTQDRKCFWEGRGKTATRAVFDADGSSDDDGMLGWRREGSGEEQRHPEGRTESRYSKEERKTAQEAGAGRGAAKGAPVWRAGSAKRQHPPLKFSAPMLPEAPSAPPPSLTR